MLQEALAKAKTLVAYNVRIIDNACFWLDPVRTNAWSFEVRECDEGLVMTCWMGGICANYIATTIERFEHQCTICS